MGEQKRRRGPRIGGKRQTPCRGRINLVEHAGDEQSGVGAHRFLHGPQRLARPRGLDHQQPRRIKAEREKTWTIEQPELLAENLGPAPDDERGGGG